MDYFKYQNFWPVLDNAVGPEFTQILRQQVEQIVSKTAHGDIERWASAIDQLQGFSASSVELDVPTVGIGSPDDCDDTARAKFRQGLMTLKPWRKGPFELFGVKIDTEWRSDWKWDRVKDALDDLAGKVVLDVGCGSGYHCFRMSGAGAKAVVGIEPFLLYAMQFLAINKFAGCNNTAVLPLRLEDMPKGPGVFNTVFSMGVIYHRKKPLEHLADLRGLMRPGGQLVLETLVLDSKTNETLCPAAMGNKRYAKMRNVHNIPSLTVLQRWMSDAGFVDVKIVDVTKTTLGEQRSTQWMKYESLADFLDAEDNSKTIEGYPSPVRAVAVGWKQP